MVCADEFPLADKRLYRANSWAFGNFERSNGLSSRPSQNLKLNIGPHGHLLHYRLEFLSQRASGITALKMDVICNLRADFKIRAM